MSAAMKKGQERVDEGTPLVHSKRPAARVRRVGGTVAEENFIESVGSVFTQKNALNAALLMGLLLSRSINVILYVRLAYMMQNYAWFLSAVLLTTTFCLICWPVVWFKMINDEITEEMMLVSKRKFFFAGSLDALSNLLSTIAASHVSGPTNVIVLQAVIPIALAIGILCLKARFSWTHYLGAFVIFAGVVVQAIPAVLVPWEEFRGWYYVLLLFLSTIPNAGSSLYKEIHIKELNVDVWYYNAWTALFQLLFGIVLLPTVFVPMLTGNPHLPPVRPDDFIDYLKDGVWCLRGYDSRLGDECTSEYGPAWSVFLAFVGITFGFHIITLAVQKASGLTERPGTSMVSSSFRLVLSAFGFGVQWLAGEAYSPLTQNDMVALLVVVAGVVLYRTQAEATPRQSPTEDSRRYSMQSSLPSGRSTPLPPIGSPPDITQSGSERNLTQSASFLNLANLGVSDFEPFGGRTPPQTSSSPLPASSTPQRGPPGITHASSYSAAHDIRRDYLRKLGVLPVPGQPVPRTTKYASFPSQPKYAPSHGFTD